ncbi:PHP domain-containing protein, partial [Candidatus Dependentiae bacterium]|nr:PHP domain-containing protein [Candidatus Dependentiae bacterium]
METKFYIKPEKDILLNGSFSLSENTQSILKNVIIERIKIDTEEKSMELDLKSKIFLNEIVQKEIVNSILAKELNFTSVKLNINSAEQELNKSDIAGYLNQNWQRILTSIKTNHPAAGGALSHNRYRYDDISKKLIIELKSEISINIVLSKKCDIMIADAIKKDTDKNISVFFEKRDFTKEIEAFKIQTEESVKNEIKRIENDALENSHIILGKEIKSSGIKKISEIDGEENRIIVEGCVLNVEIREYKSYDNNQPGISILTKFIITDYTDSIFCVYRGTRALKIKNKDCVRLEGKSRFDKRTNELTILPNSINLIELPFRMDSYPGEKHIELHLHTNMSKMDALIDVDELIKTLKRWNHTACAITDHGIVHNFPEFYEKCKKNNIKHIFGVEGYLVDAVSNIFSNHNDKIFSADCEKTFISVISENLYSDDLLGISALKYTNGKTKRFDYYLKKKISKLEKLLDKTEELNFIDSEDKLIDKFSKFCSGTVLTGFDINIQIKMLNDFFNFNSKDPLFDLRQICLVNIKKENDENDNNAENNKLSCSDILTQSLNYFKVDYSIQFPDSKKEFHPCLSKSYDESSINKNLLYNNIDPEILKKLFDNISSEYKKNNDFVNMNDFNSLHQTPESIMKTKGANHIIILVKNQTGLKNLYKLVSLAHLNYSHYTPKIPRQKLIELRTGLILGGACEQGEIFNSILKKKSKSRTTEILRFYDYAELMPVENNKFLKTFNISGIESEDDIRNLNKTLFELCKQTDKIVVATCDAHFLNPEEGIFRMAIQHYIGMKEKRDITNLCFKTTDELLNEFNYLGDASAKEIVIDNPKKISGMIDEVKPVPDGFYPPQIENADKILSDTVYKKAYNIYGNPLPEIVNQRLEKELTAIIKNQFSNLYILAHKIVKKSNDDGIIVGSRGSVGSSFVAFLAGITDVNSLPPHYVCPKCRKSEFDVPKEFLVGVDLPDKICSECSVKMIKDGYDIFFEVFLGFKGEKVPDIDLNFPGYYQPVIHKYVEELFGKENVFRAGTIST